MAAPGNYSDSDYSQLRPVLKPEERLRKLERVGTEFKLDPQVPIRRYYKSGAEMLRMANNYYEDESLAKAYVLYHKYLSLFIEKIVKHPEYGTVSSQEKARVKKALMLVLKKCEEIKAALKLVFAKDYQEYEEKLEAQRRQEAEIAQRLEQQRLHDADQRIKQETLDYRKAKESSLVEARDRELAIWTQCQMNEAKAMEDMKRKKMLHDLQDEQANMHRRPTPSEQATSSLYPSAPPPDYEQATVNNGPVHARPAIPDRSTKPLSFFDDVDDDEGEVAGLRPLYVPEELMPSFLSVAEPNTSANIETCGILAGRVSKKTLRLTHLIIPKQKGTPDSCTTEEEEDLIACLDEHNLITLGWIHTHPSQTAFLSSVDLHMHLPFQMMLPESVAIVCSPKYNETGFFVLTPDYGLDFIQGCQGKGFHLHPKEPPLFEEGRHIHIDAKASVKLIDLR